MHSCYSRMPTARARRLLAARLLLALARRPLATARLVPHACSSRGRADRSSSPAHASPTRRLQLARASLLPRLRRPAPLLATASARRCSSRRNYATRRLRPRRTTPPRKPPLSGARASRPRPHAAAAGTALAANPSFSGSEYHIDLGEFHCVCPSSTHSLFILSLFYI